MNSNTKKILEFFLEIVVWVAIWGIITYIGNEITNNKQQLGLFYVTVGIFGTWALFYIFKND